MDVKRTTWQEFKKIGLFLTTIFFIVWAVVGIRYLLLDTFRIQKIDVNTNLTYMTYDDVVDALAVGESELLFSYSKQEAYHRLKELPFVKDVRIERRLPDTLFVHLVEKKIVALFEENGKLYPIDATGAIVYAAFEENESGYIIVKGYGGSRNVISLFLDFKDIEGVLENVAEIHRIGDRRFDLIFDNGVVVNLPERNQRQAIEKLAYLINNEHVFDTDVQVIDLRDLNKIYIEHR